MPRSRAFLVAFCALVVAAAAFVVPAAAAPPTAAPASGGFSDNYYFPLAHSVRVADTRVDGGPLQGGQVRTFSLAPTFAAARPGTAPRAGFVWVLNVTVVNPTTAGYLILDSGDNTSGYASANRSNLNWAAGQTVADQVIAPVRLNETFVVWISSGSADVVIDASGFFPFDSVSGDDTTRTHYLPLATPSRLYDTRRGDGPLPGGGTRVLDLGLPASAIGSEQVLAAAVTITVTNPTGSGSLTAWDGDGPPPTTSVLNYVGGRTVTNAAVVPVACVTSGDNPCADLSLAISLSSGAAADVVIDVSGYWRLDPRGDFLQYSGGNPLRVGDSRTALRNPSRLAPGAVGSVDTSAFTPGQTSVVGVHATITAVQPTRSTTLTVFNGTVVPGTTSSTAYPGGATATAGTFSVVNNRFKLKNAFGRVDVVVDVDGFFFPESDAQDVTALRRDGRLFTSANVRVEG